MYLIFFYAKKKKNSFKMGKDGIRQQQQQKIKTIE